MNNKEKNISKKPKKPIVKSFAILIIICSLVLGIVFSNLKFSENIKLGSDFKGYYSALVSVGNLNEDESINGQPNGDSNEGAKALNERLNPMGNNQIIIEKAGKNFLKVLSPVDAYQNETIFKNQIQKNGGIVLLDSTENKYTDLQISAEESNKIERKGINDYFTGATSTFINESNSKNPAISYSLNGDNFKSLFPKAEEGGAGETREEGTLPLFILLDADGFYNDIRNYFNLIKGNKKDRIEEFFKVIVDPLRTFYDATNTSTKVKEVLYDLFYGQWTEKTSSGINTTYRGSLMARRNGSNDSLRDANSFLEVVDSFNYLAETSKYVYDSNAVTKDFETGGRYSQNVQLWNSSNTLTEKYKVNEIFSLINPVLLNFVRTNQILFNETYANNLATNYFLFNGNVTESNSQNSNGYIDGEKLITKVDSEAKARIGASLFNASGKGFVFTVNSVATIDGKVTKIMLISSLVFILIIVLCLVIFMGFFYRLLGLFSMIITLSIIGLTLLSLSWFNLAVGPETIICSFILVGLNIEIFSSLFENMKESYYLKQRGLKTSFNISIKETVGIALDLVVALLVPAMCMFWISSNAIISMAIMLAMGSFFTVLFTIVVGVILFKLVINSQLIANKSYLFALNTDFASQGKFFINYKIRKIESKIAKLNSNTKTIDKELISKLENNLKSLNEKLKEINLKDIEKNNKKQELSKAKLNKKIDLITQKIAKLNSEKDAKKIQALNFKVNELIFVRDDNTQNILEEEGQIITSTNEKLKIKTIERNIKNGTKFVSLFGVILLAVSLAFGLLFGLRFDNTFGGRTDYTLWGDNTSTLYLQIKEERFEDTSNGSADKLEKIFNFKEDLIQKHEDFISNNSGEREAIKLDETRTVSEFLNFAFEDSFYINYLAQNFSNNKSYKSKSYSVSYGDKFIFNDSSSITDINQNWITVTVFTQDLKQSAIIKKMFNNLGVDKNSNSTSGNGFITKAIKPATMLWSIKEIAISVLTIIGALVIYILIRFKWTYYIAMIVSIVLAPLVVVAAITALQIPLGNVAIIAIVGSIFFTIISLFIIFGKARTLIASKDEKSLINFFKQEIEIIYDTKSVKKKMNDELFNLKNEMRLNIKTNNLPKEEKKKLKLEFKEIKHNKKIEFKKVKKANKIKINRVAKQNNYLSEVLVKTFKFGLVRCLLLISLYTILGVVLAASMSSIWSFGTSMIIGTVISSVFVLFISLPLWVVFEQIRIRNQLARKRFINGLYVSNEEQIIEGIND
ncbi:protein translocase SecDF, variant type [Spiroplasma cantharicola]|uniref:protein translocase SecDF, variant type n=1 Tax=Spiroplasma cantharicola TaxID=362837 RepID=UPI0006B5ACA5|nr:protein translocase SecDF, variant type [Spiroplasma cantharicola]